MNGALFTLACTRLFIVKIKITHVSHGKKFENVVQQWPGTQAMFTHLLIIKYNKRRGG